MSNWTAEDDRVLVRLIDQGASASMAAMEMGRSRNSVLGRAFRKKRQFHAQQSRPPAKRAQPTRSRVPFGPDEDKILIEMAADAKSSADIAAAIKRNKSSVISRAQLLGANLSGRKGPKPSAAPKAPTVKTKKVKLHPGNIAGKKASRSSDPEFNHVTPVVAVDPLMVPLVNLDPDMCRFPCGDPREDGFGYCGHPKEQGSYCGFHAAIAYTAPEQRRRAA